MDAVRAATAAAAAARASRGAQLPASVTSTDGALCWAEMLRATTMDATARDLCAKVPHPCTVDLYGTPRLLVSTP